MLFNPRCYRENVGVEDDVFGMKAYLLCKYLISPLRNIYLFLQGICLARLIKRHHDNRGTVAATYLGLLYKLLLPFFHRDGVDDTLTLYTLQPSLYNGEL